MQNISNVCLHIKDIFVSDNASIIHLIADKMRKMLDQITHPKACTLCSQSAAGLLSRVINMYTSHEHKLISECVCITCSSWIITRLLQVVNRLKWIVTGFAITTILAKSPWDITTFSHVFFI